MSKLRPCYRCNFTRTVLQTTKLLTIKKSVRVWVNCDGVLCFIKTLHKLCKAKPDNSTCALLNTILQMLQIAINNEKKCPDFESIPLENYNINLKNVQRMMDNRLYIKFKHEDKKSQSFSEE